MLSLLLKEWSPHSVFFLVFCIVSGEVKDSRCSCVVGSLCLGSLWIPLGLLYRERTRDLAENQSRSMVKPVRLVLRPFGLDYSKWRTYLVGNRSNWFLKYIKLVLRLMINQNGGQTFLSCFLDILNHYWYRLVTGLFAVFLDWNLYLSQVCW